MSTGTILKPHIYDGTLPPGIYSLPTEVLVHIFRLLFHMSTVEDFLDFLHGIAMENLGKEVPIRRAWPELTDAEMTHHSLFPYCISSVCYAWNKICLSIPEFWTRVFIDVGSGASSILQLRQELAASQDSPISVYISRRDEFTTPDPWEHHRMDAFIKTLAPHVGRCTEICVKTMHRLSLAPIAEHLSGNAPVLETFKAYSYDRKSIPSHNEITTKSLHAPRMETIEMDVALLRCSLPRQWITSRLPDSLDALTILDVTYSDANHRIEVSLVDMFCMLNSMSHLRELSLSGVYFCPDQLVDVPDTLEANFSISRVILQHLQPHAAAAILRILGEAGEPLEALSIKNCSISDVFEAPYTNELAIDDEDITEDLLPLLEATDPHSLLIANCPSFTSDTLDTMCPESDLHFCFCPSMVGLSISGEGVSERVSVASIKKLVTTRYMVFQARLADDPQFGSQGGGGRIESLILKNFLNINDTDRGWLRSNVPHVRIFDHTIDDLAQEHGFGGAGAFSYQ